MTSYHFYENKIKIDSLLGSSVRWNDDCFFNGNDNDVTLSVSIELNDYPKRGILGQSSNIVPSEPTPF